MSSFNFNPFASFLVLKFNCPYCGEENETDALYIPSPDLTSETHHDSINSEDYEHQCHNCDHLFNICLYNGIYGGDGEISDVDGIIVDEEFPEEDHYLESYSSTYFNDNVQETIKTLEKIENLDPASRSLLYRTLYANVISSMEAYLSDRLIQKIRSDENIKRKFVETYEPYKESKFSISEIFKKIESIDSYISKSLRDIIYHKLHIVRAIYKNTLDVDLGEIGELMKCVNIRHDIVHRNGKDRNGELRDITKSDVEEVAAKVSELIDNIERQFMPVDETPIELPF